MRKFLICLMMINIACSRGQASGTTAAAQTDPQMFLPTAIGDAGADAVISELAARRGRLPETRELGAVTAKTLAAMRDDLARLAQRRNISGPKQMAEKKVALRDNLEILPGQVFDRGYALAMVQDIDALLTKLDAVGSAKDADLQNVAEKYRSTLQDHRRDAGRLLSRLGGYPWPTAP